ncbi:MULTISPECIES: sensor domain-containing protein [unclassified Mycolicibacterium]|uniref:sensor domain-containing protein n=1 Tax=unclassified Mycolicibacterium TaxID=2636767 RepID=UPI002EDA49D2
MRFVATAITVSAACILAAGCGQSQEQPAAKTPTTPMITSFAPLPLAPKILPALLLSPEEINATMAAGGMVVTATNTEMSDDSATMEPRDCLAIDGAVQAPNYADSGYTNVLDVTMREPDTFAHYAHQAVVLYGSPDQAKAFYDASAKQWPACTHYMHTQSGTQWDVAPISDKDGMLSTISTQSNAQAGGWACGRALTAHNNVVVDVNTCSANPADSAVKIAQQIAARVEKPPWQKP